MYRNGLTYEVTGKAFNSFFYIYLILFNCRFEFQILEKYLLTKGYKNYDIQIGWKYITYSR